MDTVPRASLPALGVTSQMVTPTSAHEGDHKTPLTTLHPKLLGPWGHSGDAACLARLSQGEPRSG